MLPKKNRVDKKLFNQILEKRKAYHSESLYLRLVELPNEKRFAFVVPKKIVKGAVKRIFLKRKIYNILKDSMGKIPGGYAGIFFLKKETDDYKKEIGTLLENIKK